MKAAGVTTRHAETILTIRATDFLAAGPATSAQLVAHVCQIPAVPGVVAEHMAAALFAGRAEFVRDADGMWRRGTGAVPNAAVAERPPHAYRQTVPRAHALRALSYTVIDVETTGTSPTRGDRITEIAAIRVENGEVREVFETLVNPERAIPAFITSLTSITWDMVKDAPRFGDVCGDLLARMEGTVFVAHNAAFDWRFVSAEVARATGRTLEGRRLCTVRLARVVLPQLRRRSLDWVANHYGIEIVGRHRAGGDALATAHCLVRMLRTVTDRGCDCWDDLDVLLAMSRAKRRARRASAMPQPVRHDTTA